MKAPLCLVRCSDIDVCGEPEVVPGGRLTAPLLGTREAMLLWPTPPKKVLLVKKWRDHDARDAAVEVGDWLAEEFGVSLFVYEDDEEDDTTRFPLRFDRYQPPSCNAVQYITRTSPSSSSHRNDHTAGAASPWGFGGAPVPPVGSAAGDDIDIIVSVGGDGTVLHISGLFQAAMPPVVAIAFGSLGFMTVHSLNSCTDAMTRILGGPGHVSTSLPNASPTHGSGADHGSTLGSGGSTSSSAAAATAASSSSSAYPDSGLGALLSSSAGSSARSAHGAIPVSLRMRLRVEVRRRGSLPTAPPEVAHVVLNELLLERGPSPYMATLNAYVDDEPLTTVAADGLIVATQTGSTAYSLSAGGSILSPNTAAIVFTPICPHTLSFRPLLFPDSAVIRLEIPLDARSSARCSFDGRHSMELCAGDYVTVRSCPFPLPLVCRRSATGDWVRAIKCKLYWNVRERQKAFKRPPPSQGAGGAVAGEGGWAGAPAARVSNSETNGSIALAALPGMLPLSTAAVPPAAVDALASELAIATVMTAPLPAGRPSPTELSPPVITRLLSTQQQHQALLSAVGGVLGNSPPGSPPLPASRRASDGYDGLDVDGDSCLDGGSAFADAFHAKLHSLSAASSTVIASASPTLDGADSGGAPPPALQPSMSAPASVSDSAAFPLNHSAGAVDAAFPGGATTSPVVRPIKAYRFINPPSSAGGNGSGTARAAPHGFSVPPSPSLDSHSGAGLGSVLPSAPSTARSGTAPSSPARFALPAAATAAAAVPESGRNYRASHGPSAPAVPLPPAQLTAAPPARQFLGAPNSLDYPDSLEFDSDSLQLSGVTKQQRTGK